MTATILIVSGVALLLSGGAVGWSLRGEKSSKILEAQTDLIAEMQTGQKELLEAAQKPIVIDAQRPNCDGVEAAALAAYEAKAKK